MEQYSIYNSKLLSTKLPTKVVMINSKYFSR